VESEITSEDVSPVMKNDNHVDDQDIIILTILTIYKFQTNGCLFAKEALIPATTPTQMVRA